jgi:regulatory protein
VRLSDGSLVIVHAVVAAREGISGGRALSPEELEAILAESQSLFARQRALSLLARAAHSRKGLAAKLRTRGFGAEAVRDAVERMAELGYLDDRSFAESWARARMAAHPEGWKALLKGLLLKGVERGLAAEIASAVCPEEVELEAARSVAAGLAPPKAAARLNSRGFRSRAIYRVLRESAGQAPRDAEE